MKTSHLLTTLCCCLLLMPAWAQTDSTANTEKDKKLHLKLGVFYNNRLNFYGRTDSLNSSGAFPLAEVWLGQNWYVNAAPVFVNNKLVQFEYAGSVLTAGRQGFSADKKWFSNVYVVKPIYTAESRLVQSALKWQVSGSIGYYNKILNLTVGADTRFSNRTDVSAMAGVDHIFRKQLNDKAVLVVDPSAYINAGTQNIFVPDAQEQMLEEATRFNILSYEFSAPIILATKKVQLLLIPAYVIPQNLVNVPGRPDLSEAGKEMFYITAGIKYNFR